ncbi:MAG TPA: VapC toxin family PIN domain ribonuclease, partial [Pseudolysinimonas sp.]|nr:VapC toxin family PIN domain ribonuclease [Pseudolysinimonas sp.]
MLLLDVNVLVYAMREDDHRHERCVTWLRSALDGAEPVGIPELAVVGLLRITTNHRIFVQPSRPSDV